MTKKEVETMWFLRRIPARYLRGTIFSYGLWGQDYFGDSRTVDSHIKRLRAKLDKVGIQTGRSRRSGDWDTNSEINVVACHHRTSSYISSKSVGRNEEFKCEKIFGEWGFILPWRLSS